MVMIQGESLGQRAGTLPPPPAEISLLDAPDDDDMLLARLRAGDDTAFRALVDRHRPWLVRHCTRLLNYDAHAAEDAAQESLLKLLAAAHRDGRPLRVRPWLTVVARNTCFDQQRRRRPELPGDLPERAAPGDEGTGDAALGDAWARLSGRHREVLYLREVMGFSYKEIGAVMGLTMPATETLVFRARAALKREYERSGGTSFGSGLLGFRLARLGLGRRRDVTVPDGVANAAASDPGFTNLTARLAQWVSTVLPGGEQAIAKALSVAAGVAMAAAATVLPGLSPFADGRAGAAPGAQALAAAFNADRAAGGEQAGNPSGPASAVSLKAMLGNGVPADWTPQRSRPEARTGSSSTMTPPPIGAPEGMTPLRDAAEAAHSADRPRLRRPAGDDVQPGPLRSILTNRPGAGDSSDRPHPLRSLLADPVPLLIDALPAEPIGSVVDGLPLDPQGTEPAPAEPAPVDPPADGPSAPAEPVPADRPTPVRDGVQSAREGLQPGGGNVAGHDAALLRRRDG